LLDVISSGEPLPAGKTSLIQNYCGIRISLAMDFYFSRFENRRPPEPLSTPRWVMATWQVLAVAALILGANYIY